MSEQVIHLYRGYPVVSANHSALCEREFVTVTLLPREATCKRCRQLDPYCRHRDTLAAQQEVTDAEALEAKLNELMIKLINSKIVRHRTEAKLEALHHFINE